MAELTFKMNFSDDPELMLKMMDLCRGVDQKLKRPKRSCDWMQNNGFYRSKGEFGIKVLDDDRFAILYIPKGAVVHVDSARSSNSLGYYYYGLLGFSMRIRFKPEEKALRKHRADEAYVLAMCKLEYEKMNGKSSGSWYEPYVYCNETLTLKTVYDGKSCKDSSFEYHTGAKLVIDTYDYDHDEACSEGIHFFTNAQQTLDYAYDSGNWLTRSDDMILRRLMFRMHGAELLDPWMKENIEQFKNGWGKDIYEEPCEDDDSEESDGTVHESIHDSIDAAHQAIDKLVEAVSSIKPAERNDIGRNCHRYPACGTRCNCDVADDSDDRPP